jgi:hypothetical protein
MNERPVQCPDCRAIGERAQVDFARFQVEFADEPGMKRIVWLDKSLNGVGVLFASQLLAPADMLAAAQRASQSVVTEGEAAITLRPDRGPERVGRRCLGRQRFGEVRAVEGPVLLPSVDLLAIFPRDLGAETSRSSCQLERE